MTRRRARRQIGDYGFLSDCHTAALVDRGGSIDWWCPGRFDLPSVFAQLLDDDAGHWALHPEADHTSTSRYIGPTLVLRTTFRTDAGEVEVTDGLALEPGARGDDIGVRSPHTLLRRVHGVVGSVSMAMELAPRMEYGLTSPHLSEEPEGLVARGGPLTLTLRDDVDWTRQGATAGTTFTVAAGETLHLHLEATPAFPGTETSSRAKVRQSRTPSTDCSRGRTCTRGTRAATATQFQRSPLVLQGLTYQPSGTVVAAAGAYTGAFGSDDPDASVLLLPLVGFLPVDDDRMWATVEAVERELGDIGLVRHWPGDPMGFLICTYWLSECLAHGGELDRAKGPGSSGPVATPTTTDYWPRRLNRNEGSCWATSPRPSPMSGSSTRCGVSVKPPRTIRALITGPHIHQREERTWPTADCRAR